MRRLRLTLVPALVLGASIVLSACGGDSSPEVSINIPTETTASSSLSKADFITDADTACEEVNTAISQFAASGQGLTEADQIADLRNGLVDQLEALGPPEEDRATLDQFMSALQAQVQAGQKIALASERGEDTAEFETELQTAKDQAAAAAQAYGFEQCGQEISSSSATTTAPSTSDPGTSVAPAEPSTPAPSTDSGGTGDTGGGTGDTGGGGTGGSGGVGAGGGVGPG